MSKKKQQAYLAAIRSNLKVFLRQSFETLHPGKAFMDNWHIDAIVYQLELAIEGKQPRLIINLPPRQLKSLLVSVVLPAFLLGHDPSVRIICVSYSDDLAKALAREFRRIIESDWYRSLFPEVRGAKMTENEFATEAGGFRYATSVGGTLTGRGGDFIIIDDPIKPESAASDKARNSTNDWYDNTLLSRLEDKTLSVLILVMQRLHVNDLTGYIERCGGFHKLALPAIARKSEKVLVGHDEVYQRAQGEALHESRESRDVLNSVREQIGSYNFAAQYQQTPETPEGGMFKMKWFKVIQEPPIIKQDGKLFVSIDTAMSKSESADYSVLTLTYMTREGYFILNVERGRWDYEELMAKIRQLLQRYGKRLIFLVEAANVGISVISSLKKENVVRHYYPRDDKQTRAAFALPIFHAGRVHVVDKKGQNQWVAPFLDEFASFPHGRFDDQVDSLVQLVSWAEVTFFVGRFTLC